MNLNIVAVAVAALTALALPASAATYTFRLADALPPKHIITRAVGQPFMDEVTRLAKGQVTFQHFPAGQLGDGEALLDGVKSGLADIGYIVPSHIPGKMPLSAVAELPGGYPNACVGTEALMDLALPGGLLNELELKPAGLRVLVAVVLPPYQAAFSAANLKGLSAIEGKKLRSNPGPMEMAATTLGGVPVRMTPPQIYDSLQKGTIDGYFLPYVSILSYKLDELTKSASRGANFGSVAITYAMSEKKFDQLPADIQQALVKAGKDVSLSGCKEFDAEEGKARDKLAKEGMTFVDFTGADAKTLDAKLMEIGNQWADLIDKRRGNHEAADVLKAFRAAVKSHEAQ